MPKSLEAAAGKIIDSSKAYDVDAMRGMGMGPAFIRVARRSGLKVRRAGRKNFVLGSELLEYLRDHAPIVA